MKREKVIETLDKLPEEFSTEELMDKLLFIIILLSNSIHICMHYTLIIPLNPLAA